MPKDKNTRKRMVVEEVVEPVAVAEVAAKASPVETQPELKVEEPVAPLIEPVSAESVLKTEEPVKTADSPLDSLPPVEPITPVEPNIPSEPNTPVESTQVIEEPKTEATNDIVEPIPQLTKSGGTNPLIIIIPGILLLGALLGGIYFYQKGIGNALEPSPTSELNTVTTNAPTVSATPAITLDLTKYPINIMNGSGIVGEAGRVKTLLSTDGFTISATGNATSYDFTKTIIKAKADVPADFITKLTTSLSKMYILDTNQVLATSSADKVQVIVGSTKSK